MTVVPDANLAISLAVKLPWSIPALTLFKRWREEGTILVVPALWVYEVSSVLRKHIAAGKFEAQDGPAILADLMALSIDVVGPTESLARSGLTWAARLNQRVVYDGAYLALAEQEKAQFWTADRRLFNAARALSLDWVHHPDP